MLFAKDEKEEIRALDKLINYHKVRLILLNNTKKIDKRINKLSKNLRNHMRSDINELVKNWPKNLPKGIIHADLFHDNIFFNKDKLSEEINKTVNLFLEFADSSKISS